MLDIDHFKRYNDSHGHLAGDVALKQVAFLLNENLRKVDIVARYGGEEFVVVIPETMREGAHEAVERIRSSIARYHFDAHGQQTQVTVSLGIAIYPSEDLNVAEGDNMKSVSEELIRQADEAMYRAKEEGRNQVRFYEPTR